ncbi:hypothetical protein B0H16DRAFT_1299769, partial [Mycena metata]
RHSDGTLLNAPYGENIVVATGYFLIASAMQQFVCLRVGLWPVHLDVQQVAWKNTTQLGCAVSQYSGTFPDSDGPASYYDCSYDPPREGYWSRVSRTRFYRLLYSS